MNAKITFFIYTHTFLLLCQSQSYTKQAQGYDREADYYNRQEQGDLREVEYYSKREKYD